MNAKGCDQEHENGCLREWREHEPVDDKTERDENRRSQCDLDEQTKLKRSEKLRRGDQDQGEREIGCSDASQQAGCQCAACTDAVEQTGSRRQPDQQPCDRRKFTALKRRQGEDAERDKVALRNPDDAGDRENQNEGDANQRINGTIHQSVLDDEQQDRQIHIDLREARQPLADACP